MLDGCWGHIVTLFISPMLHRFFNVVNIGTSLNVTDGFKVNDLADEFIHNKKKRQCLLHFYQDRSSNKNSFTNPLLKIREHLPIGLLL